MTEKPRIYVTFEPEIYSEVAAYGEKRRIISKSEAAQDLVRIGLKAYAAVDTPAQKPADSAETLDIEERRLLAEIQGGGGERYVPGGAHPGGAYASLQNKGFLRAEYHNRRDDLEGGFTFDGITFRVTPEGAEALKNGGYVAQMSELLEQLTPTQAEFLLAVVAQMLKPVKDYVK